VTGTELKSTGCAEPELLKILKHLETKPKLEPKFKKKKNWNPTRTLQTTW